MLEALAKGPQTVNELAALLPIARPGVSRHLRVLREADLVEVRQDAQRRVYSLRPQPLAEVDEWLGHTARCGSTGSTPCTQRWLAANARGGTPDDRDQQADVSIPRDLGRRGWQRRGAYRGSLRHGHRRPVVGTDQSGPSGALVRRGRGRSASRRRISRPTSATGWEGTGRVAACEPPHSFMVVSRDPDEPNEDIDEVWLRADGQQTVLVMEQRGLPLATSPATEPATRSMSRIWQTTSTGHERRTDVNERFEALIPAYRELAESSTPND